MMRLCWLAIFGLWASHSAHAFQEWHKKTILRVTKSQTGFSVMRDDKIQQGDELVFLQGDQVTGLAQIEKCAAKVCTARTKKLRRQTRIAPKQTVYVLRGDRRRVHFNIETTFVPGYEVGVSQKFFNLWHLGVQGGFTRGRRFRTGIEAYELSGIGQFILHESSRFEFLLAGKVGVQHFSFDFTELVSREPAQRATALVGELAAGLNWRINENLYVGGSLGLGYNTLPSRIEGKFSDYAIDFNGGYTVLSLSLGRTF